MFDGQSLADFLTENVVLLVVIVVGIGIIAKANTGETRKAVTSSGITLLGLLVIGAAAHANEISDWAWGLFS